MSALQRAMLLILAAPSLADPVRAQAVDSARPRTTVSGMVTVTNKGISTIPSFTLGKPAAILDVSIARSGFSFDPQFKWGLDGKPWSFTFWTRYQLRDRGNFHLLVGGHPALSFKTITVTTNGTQREVIVARRYLASEIYPSYSVAKNVSVGVYHLFTHGFEQDVTKNTNFVALRTIFSSIPLSDRYFVRFVPQVYYLKADARDGFYVNPAFTVGRRNFPLSIGALANKVIQTSILEGEDFIWNVSLSYSIK